MFVLSHAVNWKNTRHGDFLIDAVFSQLGHCNLKTFILVNAFGEPRMYIG